LNFGNFNSMILFGLGLAFSLGALIETLYSDDKYPGYGKVQRRYEDKQREYREKREEMGKRVFESLNVAMQDIGHQVDIFGLQLKRASLDLAATQYVFEEYGRLLVQMNKNCQEVVHVYRDENLRVRTNPPPAYFQQAVGLDPETLRLEDLELREAQHHLADIERRHEAFKSIAEEQKHRLDEIHQAQMREVNDFVGDLEKEADKEFKQDLREEQQIRMQLGHPQPVTSRES